MARTTFENISEIIIENILVEYSKNNKIEALVTSNNKSDSLISGIDGTNKGFLINLIKPNTKKIKKSKASISKKYKVLVNSKDSDNKKTKDKGNSNYSKGSQTSIKTPVITRRYIILNSSYYIKY
jgi:hypothetical protein